MPNYFYIDANGRKQGPVDKQRLQKLMDWGTITPTTPLETESGHQGMAGQIPGLDFENAIPRPKYFFTDSSGQKQGPVSLQQLQTLASEGLITPMTSLETGGGHKGVAGQIPYLDFNSVEPPIVDQTGEVVWELPIVSPRKTTENVTQLRYRSDTWTTSILSELCDFSFRDLHPETAFLWLVRSVYITGASGAILSSLCYSGFAVFTAFGTLGFIPEDSPTWVYFIALLPLLQLPFLFIACFLAICLLRFCCDCTIIAVHCILNWIFEIAKLLRAARIYVEEKTNRE